MDKAQTAQLKMKYKKQIGEYEVIKFPVKKYLDDFEWSIDIIIGLYDTIEGLLENCIIDGVRFKDIVTSTETTFLETN